MSSTRQPPRDVPGEPLHQPPNPADLRRAPPKTPACAQVRSWLRDFADNDLEPAHCRELEEHAHQCRRCAVELARAEHEVLQLRRVFAALRQGLPVLPDDFPARVVDRLVADEASLLSGEAGGQGADKLDRKAADTVGADTVASTSDRAAVLGGAGDRRLQLTPGAWLVVAFGLMLLLGLGVEFFDSANRAPEGVARLVVVEASGTFYRGRLLGAGEGLSEHQSLLVRAGGGARVNWHDRSPQPQPAATLQLHGKGEVRLEAGVPLVASGRVEIDTNRPVSIGMADGSRIDLGVGDYVIAAELFADFGENALPLGTDALQWAPADLEVNVEVVSGDPATVVRSKTGPTLIAMGQVGVYRGGGPMSVGFGGGLAASSTPQPGTRVEPGIDDRAAIGGHAVDSVGLPSVGAEVLLSFRGPAGTQHGGAVTSSSGGFLVETVTACESDFAIVLAQPPTARRELGIFAPDAVQLLHQGQDAQLIAPLVFELAVPFLGEVRDDLNQTRAGVHLVPCLVDELFGTVLPLGDRTVTAGDGSLRLDRLPARLPAHQRLVVLISHDGLEPVAIPIPTRGSAAANEQFGPLQVRRLRQVHLQNLPPNSTVQVFEEIEGLPPGTGVWRRTATTNWGGQVAVMSVGWGRMWLRAGSNANPMVRELLLHQAGPVPVYRPSVWTPYTAVFRSLQPLPDSHAEVAGSYRHQQFVVAPQQGGAPGSQVLRVLDGLDRPVVGAQVFAVDDTGPRGGADVRFLGFTTQLGVSSLQAVANGGDVVVIGRDGTVVTVTNLQAAPMTVNATLPANGRVLLHDSLRPSPPRLVAIRFEKLSGLSSGMAPVAVRFACEANNWEVGGLPPGEYRASLVGQPFVTTIDLPPDGFVVLQ